MHTLVLLLLAQATGGVKFPANIGIIGGGVGGTAAAMYVQELLADVPGKIMSCIDYHFEDECQLVCLSATDLTITVFEQSDELGGRLGGLQMKQR